MKVDKYLLTEGKQMSRVQLWDKLKVGDTLKDFGYKDIIIQKITKYAITTHTGGKILRRELI